MLWVVDYRPELHLVIIYIGYQSAINSLQQDIESTSKLDYEGANTPMGPNGSRSKLIYHDDTVYEIGLALGSFLYIRVFRLHRDGEQGLWIWLID